MEYHTKAYFESVGYRIWTRRKELGMSQEKLLETVREMGGIPCTRQTLSKIERGDGESAQKMTLSLLMSLCAAMNCELEYIMGLIDDTQERMFIAKDITGLSDNAIYRLNEMKEEGDLCGLVSELIEHRNSGFILSLMEESIGLRTNEAQLSNDDLVTVDINGKPLRVMKRRFLDDLISDCVIDTIHEIAASSDK